MEAVRWVKWGLWWALLQDDLRRLADSQNDVSGLATDRALVGDWPVTLVFAPHDG